MGLLIDSNVWIEAERGRFSLEDFLAGKGEEPVAISVVTASELLHGVHRAVNPVARERRQAFVSGILDSVTVVPFDLPIARLHAAIWAETNQKGKKLGSHDLIIAATALHLGYGLITFNAKEFQAVPGLKVTAP